MSSRKRALLLVISAPSGAGKTTLCHRLLAECGGMVRVVTCTTRAIRGSEVDGKDYHFLAEQEFAARLARNEFLEHATVHGRSYGTLRAEVEAALAVGNDVLLAIDVQGASEVRRQAAEDRDGLLGRAYVDIFIVPPSMEVLEARLVGRNEDSTAEIQRRMVVARREMECAGEYMHKVVNDDLDRALAELKAVIAAEHGRA
ncbi:MAG: guanylate kinase [bacterium]